MSDNLPQDETVPPALSGPDAPRFAPVAPGVVVDLALLESVNLSNAEERAAAAARAAVIISEAEARAAKLITAAVADAEEQVADVRPLAEARAEKIVQEAKDEAASVKSDAIATSEQITASAEETLAAAESRAAQIIEEANVQAVEMKTTLEIDRELVSERLASIERREAEAESKLVEANRLLEQARNEADRMTTEAGEAVDRMMRSGQMVAESQRQEHLSDQEALHGLQTQHASDLRELTERYETKVSNLNIENLELRQELESRAASAPAAAIPEPVAEVREDAAEPETARPEADVDVALGDNSSETPPSAEGEKDIASPWIVPEVTRDPAAGHHTFDANGDEPAGRDPEMESGSDERFSEPPETPDFGISTGLAPNTRLVEGLEAGAFRAHDDKRKRKRRRR